MVQMLSRILPCFFPPEEGQTTKRGGVCHSKCPLVIAVASLLCTVVRSNVHSLFCRSPNLFSSCQGKFLNKNVFSVPTRFPLLRVGVLPLILLLGFFHSLFHSAPLHSQENFVLRAKRLHPRFGSVKITIAQVESIPNLFF